MSTEQQEEDDFHLEEVRGSHSTKVFMMVAGIILFESKGVIEQRCSRLEMVADRIILWESMAPSSSEESKCQGGGGGEVFDQDPE